MPLIDLKTDLKSLKYGADRPGGGSSKQPYIKVDINTVDRGFNRARMTTFDDGFIRGGAIGALNASIVDTLRIGKWLADLPKGPLWIAKQIGLQKSNPKLETPMLPTGKGVLGTLGKLVNFIQDKVGLGPTRIYNSGLNTLAQIPFNAFGVHFNRHGVLPIQDDSTKYFNVVYTNNRNGNNRLLRLTEKFSLGDGKAENLNRDKVLSKLSKFVSQILPVKFEPKSLTIDNYTGGPGSVYGVGNTLIRRYDNTETKDGNKQAPQKKGVIDRYGDLGVSNQYFDGTTMIAGVEFPEVELPTKNKTAVPYDKNIPAGFNGTSVSPTFRKYKELKETVDKQRKKSRPSVLISGTNYTTPNQFGIYSDSTVFDKNKNLNTGNDLSNPNFLPDSLANPTYFNGTYAIKLDKPWSEATRELRVGSGKQDQINLTPIFSHEAGTAIDKIKIPGLEPFNINDLVKFRIQALDGDNPSIANWMIFRAYLTQLSDSTDATWNSTKYNGRGEDFYIYGGFSRKISIGFKVAALSSQEMQPMYQKLNYLMSNLMPDYKGLLMRGPLVKMTVGNWIDGQDGILNNISYNISQDSPWEIGLKINNGVEPLILPHIVDVSMTFTPIGSQTKGVNKISKKDNNILETSHIAQNINDAQYITGSIPQGT